MKPKVSPPHYNVLPSEKGTGEKKTGIFSSLKVSFEQYRLGDLLMAKGLLTPEQLSHALNRHRAEGEYLGQFLVKQNILSRSRLYQALAHQWALRSLAACLSLTLLFSAMPGKQARAQGLKDVPSQLHLASAANNVFAPVQKFPALFGSKEQLSRNLGPFTKWSGMFTRFERSAQTADGQRVFARWKRDLAAYQALPLKAMATAINSYVNAQPYILDSRNFGKSDYWATPIEFFTQGGDCEDFAIAKYASLRALGVPEERMRVAIVHDKKKDIPHAVLIVYTDREALILDNQSERVLDSASINRYRPIFSINRQAWWLHTADNTVMAAADSSADNMAPAAR